MNDNLKQFPGSCVLPRWVWARDRNRALCFGRFICRLPRQVVYTSFVMKEEGSVQTERKHNANTSQHPNLSRKDTKTLTHAQKRYIFLRYFFQKICNLLRDSRPPSAVSGAVRSRSHDSLPLTRVSKQIVNRFPSNLFLCLSIAVRWLCLLLYIPPSAC